MILSIPPGSPGRWSRVSPSGSAGVRRSHLLAFRPGCVCLEPRIALAGHVAISDAFLVHSGQQVATIAVGDRFEVEADVSTRGLPGHARLWASITVNGLTRSTPLSPSGDSQAGTRSLSAESAPFVASPGTNQVTVAVHTGGGPAEGRKAAHTRSLSFEATPSTGENPSYSVSQIRSAYGLNALPRFGSARADGAGQTIAVIDTYNDPDIIRNLQGFDESMHLSTNSSPTLYQKYGPASSIVTVYNQRGRNITALISHSGDARDGVPPAAPPTDLTPGEETLDVEWAHAIAPAARIDVIECSGNGAFGGKFEGARTAARLPGVSVVSMSFGVKENSAAGLDQAVEQNLDSHVFVTPKGHRGVTFLASAGDDGAPSGYPATSPHVIAVGATDLTVSSGVYDGETGWSFGTPRTLNYDSSSFSQSGHWTTQLGGYSGRYGVSSVGFHDTASWTTTIGQQDLGHDNGVEVSATWVALPTNATSVTYDIYDTSGATRTLLGSQTVDQAKAPIGTSDGGTHFQELGVVYPAVGSTLTVTISTDSATDTLVADAIGIAPALATGGGPSRYEAEPVYQLGVQSTGYRTTPDVAFEGASESGVTLYRNGTLNFGTYGTSLSSPCWAGLIAIADQGRVARGAGTLGVFGNRPQALEDLYSLPASDFNVITSGYNGYSASAGYDFVSGLGSPIVGRLIPALIAYRPRAHQAT